VSSGVGEPNADGDLARRHHRRTRREGCGYNAALGQRWRVAHPKQRGPCVDGPFWCKRKIGDAATRSGAASPDEVRGSDPKFGGRYRSARAWPLAAVGRVEVWRSGCRLNISVAAPFVWRCLTGSTLAPFPHPAHRTGHADRPHPALGQDLTPSPTTGRVHAGSDVRARSARRGARVDTSRLGVA
jgi:hypothetical protein